MTNPYDYEVAAIERRDAQRRAAEHRAAKRGRTAAGRGLPVRVAVPRTSRQDRATRLLRAMRASLTATTRRA
jgi:hypothetical protein